MTCLAADRRELESLILLGIQRVLTSGGETSAQQVLGAEWLGPRTALCQAELYSAVGIVNAGNGAAWCAVQCRRTHLCAEPPEAFENGGSQGSAAIAALVKQAAGRIIVMAGGGVRSGNVLQLVADTGVSELHSSARRCPSGF